MTEEVPQDEKAPSLALPSVTHVHTFGPWFAVIHTCSSWSQGRSMTADEYLEKSLHEASKAKSSCPSLGQKTVCKPGQIDGVLIVLIILILRCFSQSITLGV